MSDWPPDTNHRMGVLCIRHRNVLQSEYCPEPGCPGRHGFTVGSCDSRCPEHPKPKRGTK
jgi:hypothetical protein